MNQERTPTVLVADQDNDVLHALEYHLVQWGYQVACANHQGAALKTLEQQTVDLVLLDLCWSRGDGMEFFTEIVDREPNLPVIILTAQDSVPQVVRAVKLGAYDFLTKPPQFSRLEQVVAAALKNSPSSLPAAAQPAMDTSDTILGTSWPIQHVRELIAQVAATDAKILITGESGTGKELVARAIHQQSLRAERSFVPVNTAALPATLAESVLFGHEKGSFTGADEMQQGWCEVAHEGTLFLDEIGEMDVILQAKLLRFLQDHTFQRVGSSKVRTSDVRVIAATNGEPPNLIDEGRLRSDLYHRLNVVPIHLPPLRERREDIPILVDAFVKRYAARFRKPVQGLTTEAIRHLQAYAWPGNVRELENIIQRLVVLSKTNQIDVEQLPPETWAANLTDARLSPNGDRPHQPRAIDQMEKKAILDALRRTEGNAVSAARLLGMGQATMYRKIKRYQIPLKRIRCATEPIVS
ncbi:MAG: sigma-54-dependent Fis family transcriptional regulator [Planctomycetales bacterium]|nr:sigma-54-dependent Fis family transcriptional regulator [Planctomycetales bacterium]